MSFKPRIAFVDEKENNLYMPEDISAEDYSIGIRTGNAVKVTELFGGDKKLRQAEDLTSLISTGKKDKNDKEIIDGHIIHQQFYDMNNQPTHQGKGIVVWDDSTEDGMNCLGFRVIPIDYDNERHYISNTDNVRVVGHALTNPEMTPGSFDVEAYFND